MKQLWFSPLAPALLFLAGAIALLASRRLAGRGSRTAGTLAFSLSLTAAGGVFILLASRVAYRLTSSFTDPPLVLAPWGTGEGLTIRLDGVSIAFLFVPVLLLVASVWARQITACGIMLALAGSAAAVFVAANGISFSYALLLFDVVGMVYWLQTRQPTLALARLLLAIVTTSALMLAGLNAIAAPGGLLLAFALWLRVGLMPFVEIPAWQDSNCLAFGEQGRGATCGEAMVWLALSTLIGVYAIARFLTMPVPAVVGGLALATMLLNGALAWLGKPGNREVRVTLLRLVATQPVLALLIAPLPATPSVALGLGYTLALGALWLTPRLGRPDFFERHWLWIYAVPLLATLSLAGFPFTLGWVAHRSIYAGLLVDNRRSELALALLAEGSAFSALVPYWRNLLSERRTMNRGLLTALPVTIPFLLPGVAGIVFTAITGLRFAGSPAQTGPAVWANLGLLWLLAAALGVGRRAVLNRLALNPGALEPFIALNWLWPFIEQAGATAGSAVLRLKAVLEGAHYLGWAFLIALAGILVVVLS